MIFYRHKATPSTDSLGSDTCMNVCIFLKVLKIADLFFIFPETKSTKRIPSDFALEPHQVVNKQRPMGLSWYDKQIVLPTCSNACPLELGMREEDSPVTTLIYDVMFVLIAMIILRPMPATAGNVVLTNAF
jgi:hypothetical protein